MTYICYKSLELILHCVKLILEQQARFINDLLYKTTYFSINPILHGLWNDVVTWGGHYGTDPVLTYS